MQDLLDRSRDQREAKALAAAIDAAMERFDRLLLSRGPIEAPFIALAELASNDAQAAQWRARERALHPEMDPKTKAALSIGRFALAFCYAVAVPAITVGEAIDMTPGRVGVALMDEAIGEGAESRPGVRFSIRIADPVRSAGPIVDADGSLDPVALDALHRAIVEGHDGIVARHHAATGLSVGALWRLVADMTCFAFMKIAGQIGRDDFGRALGSAITTRPGSPLNNGKSGYEYVEVDGEGAWFLRRGGCCRVYTLPAKDYCPSCVLHRPEVRRAIMTADMRAARRAAR